MSLSMLKQNAEILLEVSQNYDRLLDAKNKSDKKEQEKYDIQLKNFKNQFLYLLTAINKNIEKEKNAK